MSAWHEFLTWIEMSALGHAVRNTGVWTYGIINLFHILGIATLFGSILLLDLRLIGWRRKSSVAEIASLTIPLAKVGFAIAVCSGICLLATNGSEYIGNPFLIAKFAAIALALANALALSRLSAWKRREQLDVASGEHKRLAFFGALSLVFWFLAVAAGRLIGYW